MLSKEDNELLTHVGPGTPMGDLLRRYWMPALLSIEIPAPDSPPVRVRILAEDLVAVRDTNGDVGLFAQACPHRGASLFFGRNEEAGLRCVYHGWKFDVTGRCVDMPSEPAASNFKDKVKTTAYPTHESGGIVWAFMGPREKMTSFRDLGADSLSKEQWQASKTLSECNWVQGLEGNLDTVHISFLHRNLADFDVPPDETDKPGVPSPQMSTFARGSVKAPRIEIEDTWYGYRYAGLRETPNGFTHVRLTDFILPFMCYISNIPVGGANCLMMVPIDDNNYWRMTFATKADRRVRQGGSGATQPAGGVRQSGVLERIQSSENDFMIDREAQRSVSFTGIKGIGQQDMAVTESMGSIYDRSHEHLGTTDQAVIHMRRMLVEAANNLEEGVEPPAIDASLPFRDIRSAERIIASGEDWRLLGTSADPEVAQVAMPVIQ